RGNEPSITGRLKYRQKIGDDCPPGLLREHVHIPTAPAQEAIKKESAGAESGAHHHRDGRNVALDPRPNIRQSAPAFSKNRVHHRIARARYSDDPRRRHQTAVKHGQGLRSPSLSRAPEHESKKPHHEERLRIARDEEERRRVREDRERAEELQERRDVPPLAEQEKITPERPGRSLSGHE